MSTPVPHGAGSAAHLHLLGSSAELCEAREASIAGRGGESFITRGAGARELLARRRLGRVGLRPSFRGAVAAAGALGAPQASAGRPGDRPAGDPVPAPRERGAEGEVHVPVLAEAVAGAFETVAGGGGWVVDATLGAGGHSQLLLERYPELRLLGTDQDPEILALAQQRLAPFGERVQLECCRISDLARVIRKLRIGRPVGILMDVGVSSLQLDRAERGFSFLNDGPLDMRMDPERERTAADIVNNWDESDLADLFFHEGDEHRSRPIARAIVESRRRAPFQRTGALADLIARTLGGGGGRIHPATRVFQALRRAVNEEGEELRAGLETAEHWLDDGGVLAVISFHSGEDGEVKRFLADGGRAGRWEVVTRKPVRPDHNEVRTNSRARSSRLRIARRLRSAEDIQPEVEL